MRCTASLLAQLIQLYVVWQAQKRAGKTRVAELSILRCLAIGKRVLFITPLRVLSAQTESSLKKTFLPLGKTVSLLYGSIGTSDFELDFRYHGQRCREIIMFIDSKTNRKKLQSIIQKIEAEILLGTFDYKKYFPKSDKADKMVTLNNKVIACRTDMPIFEDFANLWFEEKQIEWRPS